MIDQHCASVWPLVKKLYPCLESLRVRGEAVEAGCYAAISHSII